MAPPLVHGSQKRRRSSILVSAGSSGRISDAGIEAELVARLNLVRASAADDSPSVEQTLADLDLYYGIGILFSVPFHQISFACRRFRDLNLWLCVLDNFSLANYLCFSKTPHSLLSKPNGRVISCPFCWKEHWVSSGYHLLLHGCLEFISSIQVSRI